MPRQVRLLPLVLAALTGFAGMAAHAGTTADPLIVGKRIYHEGIDASGNDIAAVVRSDVMMQGAGLACVHCHRRSGFGSSESRVVIPPILGSMLFASQQIGLRRDYRDGRLGNIERPAYTAQTLARALRDGIDSSGRALVPMMPRYAFTDTEVAALTAYLNTLSDQPSPGISAEDIHFATVVAPGVDATARQAAQAVFDAYLTGKNAGTRSELRRAERAPFQKEWSYAAYRKWQIHTWELQGPEEGWAEQLARFYQQQPVFAMLGGIGTDHWQPVHDFCEANQVPCLFPHLTTPPLQAKDDFYAIYFSTGLRLQAQALKLDLATEHNQRIVQVRRQGVAASAAQALSEHSTPTPDRTITEVVVENETLIDRRFWQTLLAQHKPDVLVLWLGSADRTALDALATLEPLPVIYLSSTLFPDSTQLTTHALAGNIRLLHPYLLPHEEQKTLRFATWAKLSGIELVAPRVQADAYFAVTLAGEALMHIRSNQSRDYFIERIEHMTDSMLNTAFYPRLSLAPGQRHAAKGTYVWPLKEGPQQARWIVP